MLSKIDFAVMFRVEAASVRWGAMLDCRGDYGLGDSDGTLNELATIGLQFAETTGLNFGCRHATIELEEDVGGSQESTDIALSGPYIGLSFRF